MIQLLRQARLWAFRGAFLYLIALAGGAEKSASRYHEPFPVVSSKKGLQVQMLDDAIALGIKHGALNVNLTSLIDLSGATNSLPWEIDGRTVRFHQSVVVGLDRQVKRLSDAGAVVSLILLTYASGDAARDALMLHPRYDKKAPNRLGNFNTVTPGGALHFRACMEFLCDRYNQPGHPQGRAVNFILGNEVNSHWFWANMGRVTMEEFADDYLRTARLASAALRKISSSARLYLSLEHHWNIRYPGGNDQQAFPARPFLDYFNRRAKEHGNFEWHIAFHPYPENLFEPRTWRDKSATPHDTTPRITFKNLEVLVRYLRQPELLFEGKLRRVILSEQGFHTPDRPDGEILQAAGYAYAWRKVAALDGIDSFILHRHVDHAVEGGLKLGLWSRDTNSPSAAAPLARKKIYEVFRAADTPQWEEAFRFALPVIGLTNWNDLR